MLEVLEDPLHLPIIQRNAVLQRPGDLLGVVPLLLLELVLQLPPRAVRDRQLKQREVGAIQLQRSVEPPRVLEAPLLPRRHVLGVAVRLAPVQPEVVPLDRVDQHALRVDRDRPVLVHHQLRREHLVACALASGAPPRAVHCRPDHNFWLRFHPADRIALCRTRR